MVYVGQLATGQLVQIQQQGNQTAIALLAAGVGQQQQQQLVINTGVWLVPPTLFQLPMGVVLRLETAQGQHYIHLQGNAMQTMATPPVLLGAAVLPLQQVDLPAATPLPDLPSMPPMQPLQPLSMGNMQMQMKPMVMRMGNMELRMDSASSAAVPPTSTPTSASTPANQRFCTQCGHPVKASDRFCGACGHGLTTD